jgi:hypothetical protein
MAVSPFPQCLPGLRIVRTPVLLTHPWICPLEPMKLVAAYAPPPSATTNATRATTIAGLGRLNLSFFMARGAVYGRSGTAQAVGRTIGDYDARVPGVAVVVMVSCRTPGPACGH